ncbi:MAG TPA: hypothetical protein VGC97_03895 [Pyrinomonadaceae bacterium]|jgi:hypothetical protein
MKKILPLILLSLCFVTFARAQFRCVKFQDASLGVSMCAPVGWAIADGIDNNKVIVGERTDNFTRNINVKGAVFPGTVSQAAAAGIAYILKTKPGGITKVALSSKKAFTAGKEQGVKVVFKAVAAGRDVKSIQYYFSGKGKNKIVVTATLFWSDDADLETIIDNAVKTIELKK